MKRKSSGALRVLVLCAASTPAFAQYVGTSPATPSGGPPATPSAALSQDFSIYPKNGQTHEQQSADLYQCYSWAKGQTGFDPTQVSGGVAASDIVAKRDQYRRAMTVCLEARGYDVHYAAVPSSPPAAPAPPISAPPTYAPPAYSLPAAGASNPYQAPELKYHPLSVQIEGGYTATAGATNNELNGGANMGLGITWFPTSALPVGLRVDGSETWLDERRQYDTNGGFNFGHESIYGGDADVQLDLAHPYRSIGKLYLLGGVGEYREWTDFKQVSWVNGTVCWQFFCGPGQFPAVTGWQRMTSPWRTSWNAGLGAEFALGDHASFFVEARYLRILPYSSKMQLVPVRVGFRF